MTIQQFIETNSKFLDNKCVRCMPVRIRLQLVDIYNECHEEKLINRVSDHAKAYEWIRSQITPAETPVEEKPKVKRTRKPKTE